ncbi:hypothetical protein PHYPSEUDO_012551 [Phytophthora pseudosyringae]|uniref:Uncharacterized protein n=1 Tax=Phytophthora pseudosyringae TaxID=221518 RepID=A0A8T1V9Y2_9STRA|nr:hypothetical protein PHYPSEUDO_012551 [Phytophthora pseudosyringae]
MVPEHSRSRGRQATLVVRASRRRQRPLHGDAEAWTPQGQRVLTVPAEQAAPRNHTHTDNERPDAATARLLLAHAHRARHLLADRSVLASVQSTRRSELMQEIQRMRRVMRTLEEQVGATARSLEAMERLVAHLRRVTDLLQEAGVMPALATARDAS